MKLCVLAVMVVAGVALGGDFGKEANKSSVAAQKKLLLVRENPATGEKVVFDATAKGPAIKALLAQEDSAKRTDELQAAIDNVKDSQDGVTLAASAEKGSSATTAWWGWYYGSVYVVYYRIVYYTYTYVPYWGGYNWYWYY